MGIMKVSGLNESSENNFLDITQLVEFGTYTKVAYVVKATSGLAKNQSGFARFLLKDIHGRVINATLFNVEDYVFSGIKLTGFNHKPVELSFVVQEFNGSLSLVIDSKTGIKTYDGTFPYEQFIGNVSFNDSLIKEAHLLYSGVEDWEIPVPFKTCSFDSIAQGRVGGFAKLLEISLGLIMCCKDFTDLDIKDLLEVYFITMSSYYKSLQLQKEYDFISHTKDIDLLSNVNQEYYEHPLKAPIIDSVSAILGFSQPKHLFSHIIIKAVRDANNIIDLVLTNNNLIVGHSMKIGGDVLLKY